jgi:hypothetical protein
MNAEMNDRVRLLANCSMDSTQRFDGKEQKKEKGGRKFARVSPFFRKGRHLF